MRNHSMLLIWDTRLDVRSSERHLILVDDRLILLIHGDRARLENDGSAATVNIARPGCY